MRDSNTATKNMLAKIEDAYFKIRMLFRHGRKMFFAQERFFDLDHLVAIDVLYTDGHGAEHGIQS